MARGKIGIGLRTLGIGLVVGIGGVNNSLYETKAKEISFLDVFSGPKEEDGKIAKYMAEISDKKDGIAQYEARIKSSENDIIKAKASLPIIQENIQQESSTWQTYQERIQSLTDKNIGLGYDTERDVTKGTGFWSNFGWSQGPVDMWKRTAQQAEADRQKAVDAAQKLLDKNEDEIQELEVKKEESDKRKNKLLKEYRIQNNDITQLQGNITVYNKRIEENKTVIKNVSESLEAEKNKFEISNKAFNTMNEEWKKAYDQITGLNSQNIVGSGKAYFMTGYRNFIAGAYLYPLMRTGASGLTVYSNHLNPGK
jgi:predicted  nucleic acid-binding Zn-ribbon protein